MGHTIIQLDTVKQQLLFVLAQGTQNAHGIFALQAKARVHQIIGQLTRTGKQQQALGVDVQSPDRLPLPLHQFRQLSKHGRTVLRVIMRDNLTHWLVVRNHPRRWRVDAEFDRFAIDLDMITELNALTNMGRLIVDGDAPLHDQLFHLKA